MQDGAAPHVVSRPVFAIFQGGGAAGIAHLGAAVAAEEEGLEFVGVAGASAGAFVAALLAGGYRGKELFNPGAKGSDLLSRYGKSPLDLLGTERWKQAIALRQVAASLGRSARRPRWAVLWPVVAWRVWRMVRPFLPILRQFVARKGHFDTSEVREFVNWALREKLLDAHCEAGLPSEEVPQRITFADLDVNRFAGFRPLKIIATDVGGGRAALFSQTSNAGVEVGAAVAASIAIPGVFQPVSLPGLASTVFADGGLVSNLPVWTFLEEKLAYERRYPTEDRVPILAFTLEAPLPAAVAAPGAPSPSIADEASLAYAMAVIRAGISGSQEVGQRLVADLVLAPLRPALGVLGFDASWREILECFSTGRRDAKRAFVRSLRLRPDRVREELRVTVAGMRQRIDAQRTVDAQRSSDAVGSAPDQAGGGRVRGSVIVPAGQASLRVAITSGADTEADDNLLLDRGGPGCARAFRDRDILVVQVGRDTEGGPVFTPAGLMTRYEAALLWRRLRSMVCIPIFADSRSWTVDASERKQEPLGVLSLDSDRDLEHAVADEAIRSWLIERSVILSSIMAEGHW